MRTESNLAEVVLLDLSKPEDVSAYERSFYHSFSRAKSNQLVRGLWIWDDELNRLKTKIPYKHQIIFAIRDAWGEVKTAMAVNLSSDYYQASAFGFERPDADREASCEILTFFSTRKNKLTSLHQFLVAISHHGPQKNMRWADATCTQRLLPIYLHLGAELLGRALIETEHRYHLRFHIASFAGIKSLLRPGS